MDGGQGRAAGCSRTATKSQPNLGSSVGNLERTNRMGPTTKTRIATMITSRIMRYITQSTPKDNHQRCGDECRQVLVELNTNIWVSTNQTSVNVDPRSDNLSVPSSDRHNVRYARLEGVEKPSDAQHRPGIDPRIWRWARLRWSFG
jgi:hypothetical protein